jgi:predicted RNase H-like HicB family nuclease
VGTFVDVDYPVEITRDGDGFFIRIPDLPGCESNADTIDEALESIEEAKEAWIEAALATGKPVPSPRTDDDYSGKFVVRVGRSLHRDLVRIALIEGMSLNALVSTVLARETGRYAAPLRRREADASPPRTATPVRARAAPGS